jgi:hypothetical protein
MSECLKRTSFFALSPVRGLVDPLGIQNGRKASMPWSESCQPDATKPEQTAESTSWPAKTAGETRSPECRRKAARSLHFFPPNWEVGNGGDAARNDRGLRPGGFERAVCLGSRRHPECRESANHKITSEGPYTGRCSRQDLQSGKRNLLAECRNALQPMPPPRVSFFRRPRRLGFSLTAPATLICQAKARPTRQPERAPTTEGFGRELGRTDLVRHLLTY